MRYLTSGARPSTAQTRFWNATPANDVRGSVIAGVPALPACVTELNHRTAFVPSPGMGKEWASVQVSTVLYARLVLFQYCVVTDASFSVVQKDGAFCAQGATVQCRSQGTSGQL